MKVRSGVFLICLLGGALGVAFLGCGNGQSGTPDPTEGGTTPPRDPILDGGGEIPPPPNGAALCPMGVCNYQTGTGCMDAGAASCVPLPVGSGVAPTCERAGQTPTGGTCAQWTDCVSGSICAAGRCRKLCCGRDWTGCGTPSEHCLRPLQVQLPNTNTVVESGAYLCYPVNQCDALVPSSCAAIEANTTCQIADPTGATACLPEGKGGFGSPCPCKGGFACVEGGCRRLCRAVAGGGEPSCPATEGTCVHFNRDPAGVGECTPN